MKRNLAILPLLALLLSLWAPHAAAARTQIQLALYDIDSSRYVNRTLTAASITLDGAPLDSDLPPFLYQSRTMAPVRLLAERFGATVDWVEASRQVYIQTEDKEIILTIGSPTALVNGQEAPLPDGVSAVMASYQGVFRTMVPLRFVSEYLGATVAWDAETYTAIVISPGEPAPPGDTGDSGSVDAAAFRVTDIQADDNAQSVFISVEGTPNYILQDFGDRAVVDLPGGVLTSNLPASIPMENEIFSAVRYSGHTDLHEGYNSSVRVVLDLRPGFTCTDNVSVSIISGGILIQTTRDSSNSAPLPADPIDPSSSTIVLDAGHGGNATGALYEGIPEKNINLSVTRKLAVILENYGYNVILTRTGDESVGLYERAELANRLEADVFVSLHSNAAPTVPTFTGIYTYHYPNSRRGSLLAQYIQSSVVAATGAIDRGIESANFVVLRETSMPAALVEMGFMTNHNELTLLTDGSYQDKLAQGIAQGIVRYLNSQK